MIDATGGAVIDPDLKAVLEEERSRESVNLNLSRRDLLVLPSEIGLLVQLETVAIKSGKLVPFTILELESKLPSRVSFCPMFDDHIGNIGFVFIVFLHVNECASKYFISHTDLSKNKIKKVPTKIGNLKVLKVLSLSKNRLYYLPNSLGQLNDLEVLKIDNNPLQWPPASICVPGPEVSQAEWLGNLRAYLRQEVNPHSSGHSKSASGSAALLSPGQNTESNNTTPDANEHANSFSDPEGVSSNMRRARSHTELSKGSKGRDGGEDVPAESNDKSGQQASTAAASGTRPTSASRSQQDSDAFVNLYLSRFKTRDSSHPLLEVAWNMSFASSHLCRACSKVMGMFLELPNFAAVDEALRRTNSEIVRIVRHLVDMDTQVNVSIAELKPLVARLSSCIGRMLRHAQSCIDAIIDNGDERLNRKFITDIFTVSTEIATSLQLASSLIVNTDGGTAGGSFGSPEKDDLGVNGGVDITLIFRQKCKELAQAVVNDLKIFKSLDDSVALDLVAKADGRARAMINTADVASANSGDSFSGEIQGLVIALGKPLMNLDSDLTNFDRDLYLHLRNVNRRFSAALSLPFSDEVTSYILTAVDAALEKGTSSVQGYPSLFIDRSAEQQLAPEYRSSHKGKPCGHIFKVGEALYWCKNCALDDTCVLCQNCFHATDHDGHETSFSISQGSGGCCDCGDKEAWKVPLKCAYHTLDEGPAISDDDPMHAEAAPIPEAVQSSIRTAIATVLDFIIDTYSWSPIDFTLPNSVSAIRAANPPNDFGEDTEGQNPGETQYACVLWNDEEHSFMEVIQKIEHATHCNRQRSSHIAQTVDAIGREVVYASAQLGRLFNIARVINGNDPQGLAVTIRTTRDTIRENVASLMITWLKELPNRMIGSHQVGETVYASLSTFARDVVCQELSANRRNVEQMLFGIADNSEFYLSRQGSSTMDVDQPSANNAPRLTHLLNFDSRLWKELRATLRDFYISTMIVNGDDHKRALGMACILFKLVSCGTKQTTTGGSFAQAYLLLSESFLLRDREWDLSVINFSVQIFTVPTISQHLVTTTSVFPAIANTLKAFFLSEVYPSVLKLEDFSSAFKVASKSIRASYPKLICESEKIYMRHRHSHIPRYQHLFEDMRYLLSSPYVRIDSMRGGEQQNFKTFVDLCKVFQGMNRQKRQQRNHVEFESQGWTNSFDLSSRLGRLIEHVTDAFGPTTRARLTQDFACLQNAIQTVFSALDTWCSLEQASEVAELDEIVNFGRQEALRRGETFHPPPRSVDGFKVAQFFPGVPARVVEYLVLRRPVTLHHPLHWLLSSLLTLVPVYLTEMSNVSHDAILGSLFVNTNNSNDDIPLNSFADIYYPSKRGVNTDDSVFTRLPDVSNAVPNDFPLADRFCRLVDHCLRVEALLSQIRGGLWVRNGQSMRNQALYFKHLFLRDLYDHNLFLMQWGCVILGSDRFITSMLERFTLSAWFSGKPADTARQLSVDPAAMTVLAEDFVNLLIVLITERGRASSLSVENQLRREIIHSLAPYPNGLPHSKIADSIPDYLIRLTHGLPTLDNEAAEFNKPSKGVDELLPELANFKFPDGTNDKGLYELRDEFFDEVDPWFCHYSRTQREEVDATLSKRASKKARDDTKTLMQAVVSGSMDELAISQGGFSTLCRKFGVRNATCMHIDVKSGMSSLNSMVSGKVFTRMIFYGLVNVMRRENPVRSEVFLSALLHLIMVSMDIESASSSSSESSSFLRNAGTVLFDSPSDEIVQKSVVSILLDAFDRRDEDLFKDHGSKLALMLIRLGAIGGPTTKEAVLSWRAKQQSSMLESDGPESGASTPLQSDGEKKKAAAKMRQAAIMAQFAKQQQSFMEAFGDDGDEDSEMVSEQEYFDADNVEDVSSKRLWSFVPGNCIVCQEELAENQMFGMIALMQSSHLNRSRFVDFRQPDTIHELLATPESLDVEIERPNVFVTGSAKSLVVEGGLGSKRQAFPKRLASDGNPNMEIYNSSCGHMMHYSCFDSYRSSIERRQTLEPPPRIQPENLDRHEFLCPLCKSLGNCLFPVIKSSMVEQLHPSSVSELHSYASEFAGWREIALTRLAKAIEEETKENKAWEESRPPELMQETSDQQNATQGGTGGGSSGLLNRFMEALRSNAINEAITGGDSADTRPGRLDIQDAIIRIAQTFGNFYSDVDQFDFLEALIFSFSFSVENTEFISRGTGAKLTENTPPMILDTVNKNTIQFLRVFSESIQSFSKSAGLSREDRLENLRKLKLTLWPTSQSEEMSDVAQNDLGDHFALKSAFQSFVVVSMYTNSLWSESNIDEIFEWLHVFWLIEVFQNTLALLESMSIFHDPCWSDSKRDEVGASMDEDSLLSKSVVELIKNLLHILELDVESIERSVKTLDTKVFVGLVEKLSLPFLRKVSLFLSVRYGIVPAEGHRPQTAEDVTAEYLRLASYLRLPVVSTVVTAAASVENSGVRSLFEEWMLTIRKSEEFERLQTLKTTEASTTGSYYDSRLVVLPTPSIPELIPLPRSIETLFEEGFRQICPNCNKNIVDPALCLICGTWVCSMSFCCTDDDMGESLDISCGGDIGLFFLIKQFKILFLHHEKGCLLDPPYLDSHGEAVISFCTVEDMTRFEGYGYSVQYPVRWHAH
ncbi:hypothetical protein HDU76_002758 [Blyttiomyces sp. JEL0837]|nr:hypothetical protein HDU76_002758 [Blyttiomyces sp. JEL0837]